VPAVIAPNACAWSAAGRVAISYAIERGNISAVTVLSSAGAAVSHVQMDGSFDVAGWLADGSAVIRGVEDPDLGNQNVVLMLDGSLRSLPFSPERILAVIPPP